MATQQESDTNNQTSGKAVVQMNFRTAAATRARFENFKRQRAEVVGHDLTLDEAFQDLMETVEAAALLDASENDAAVTDRLLLKRFLEGVNTLFTAAEQRAHDAELLHRPRVADLQQQIESLTAQLHQATRTREGIQQAAETERETLREELKAVIDERDRERARFRSLEEAVEQLGADRARLVEELARRDERVRQLEADTKQTATEANKELRALRSDRDAAAKQAEAARATALDDRSRITRYADLTETLSKDLEAAREELRALRVSEATLREEKARFEGRLEVFIGENAEAKSND